VDKDATKGGAGLSESASFEELAASQGVPPVTDFDALLGLASAEDESPEAFAAMLRNWRCEGTAAASRQ
jgi:hypothetical protein